MSSLIVEVCKIDKIKEHPNADNIEIAVIKGWTCCTKKGQYEKGDTIVYCPPDCILPDELIEKLGVRNYLSGNPPNRVKQVKLRGEISAGLIIPNDKNIPVGENVAELYCITKYEPPIRVTDGMSYRGDSHFPKMIDIENMRNFPDIFEKEEMVAVTEKIDGSQFFTGVSCVEFKEVEDIGDIEVYCLDNNKEEPKYGIWKASSHRLMRKRPIANMKENIYWYPYMNDAIYDMIEYFIIEEKYQSVQLFGEVYGRVRGGLKSMHYGKQNELAYVAFRLRIDGKYIPYKDFKEICDEFKVEIVPLIDIIPYNFDKIKELSQGNSILAEKNGTKHMREGVVAVSYDKIDGNWLKFVNDEYLLKKEKQRNKGEEVDFTDV